MRSGSLGCDWLLVLTVPETSTAWGINLYFKENLHDQVPPSQVTDFYELLLLYICHLFSPLKNPLKMVLLSHFSDEKRKAESGYANRLRSQG